MKKTFQAIERRSEVRAAMKVWRAKFGEGAEVTQAMGGTVEWHPAVGIWDHFSSRPREGRRPPLLELLRGAATLLS